MSASRKSNPADAERGQVVDALASFVRTLVSSELEAVGQRFEELDLSLSRRIADLDERADSTLGELKRDLQAGLESVRAVVDGSDERLGARVDRIANTVDSALGGLERDLRPRMDTLDRLVADLDQRLSRRIKDAVETEQELRSSVTSFGERLDAGTAELERRVQTAVVQVEAARGAAEGEVAVEREARQALAQRVQGLSAAVAAAQKKIQEQLETAQRLSTVLNTLTSVFSSQRGTQAAGPGAGAKAGVAQTEQAAGTISDSSLADLDSALNKLFQQ